VSRLIDQGRGTRRLRKAADADRDPAAALAGAATAPDGQSASEKADNAASISASISASSAASGDAGGVDSKEASDLADHKPLTSGLPAPRPRRRPGRPKGPQRVALSVRIRPEIDQRLTAAVEHTSLGPQQIVEAALVAWLDANLPT